jgi:hypothetical protein
MTAAALTASVRASSRTPTGLGKGRRASERASGGTAAAVHNRRFA